MAEKNNIIYYWLNNRIIQEEGKGTLVMIKKMKKTGDRSNAAGERRILRGLGSSPPRCLSKCGRCTPCKPVHVPVPPGTPVTAEYYPEAWRCKCGNKLYMPWCFIYNIYTHIYTLYIYDSYEGSWSALCLCSNTYYILNMLLGQLPA